MKKYLLVILFIFFVLQARTQSTYNTGYTASTERDDPGSARFGVNSGWGSYSTNIGIYAARNIESEGTYNVNIGYAAGYLTTTGDYNVFIGAKSGYSNDLGHRNVCIGDRSGYNLATVDGNKNVFIGYYSGYKTTKYCNTFVGYQSGYNNTVGLYNTFLGHQSGLQNIGGDWNVFVGNSSGASSTEGNNNSFFGPGSGSNNTTGSDNTYIGRNAGSSNQTGSYNTVIGASAVAYGTTNYTNSTSIGYRADAGASNRVRIGNDDVTRIGGVVSWSTLSDGRYKKNVDENVAGLDFINQLRPVNYDLDMQKFYASKNIPEIEDSNDVLKSAFSHEQLTQRHYTGFIAQEVEKIIQDNKYVFNAVQSPENEGDEYAIRYAEFVVPLVKAVQELSAMVEKQQKEIDLLKTSGTNQPLSENNNGIILQQSCPNPFTQEMEIGMYLPETICQAELRIVNMNGTLVRSLPVYERGNTTVQIYGVGMEAGIYMYSLIADGQVVSTKKMVLTK